MLLDQAMVPVPKGELVRSADDACAAAERLGYPVVTKPLDGNHGRGVSIDLRMRDQVRWGFEQARKHSRTVIVEQFFTGADHRILVIGGEVVAVAERVPAHVIGDGKLTIAELVDAVNRDPRRGVGHASVLTRIEIDEHVENFLQRSGLNPAHVPAAGQTVMLRPTANLSTGGTAIDRTDEIHPDNALIARRAAKIVGLDIAGIDFVCADIRKSVLETGGGIIEVNAGPGFRMHLEPFQGRPRNVARPVLELLFPKGTSGRIPIFAITGTNGKTTTARMLDHILRWTGETVGLTSSTGIYLNGHRIVSGDCSGPPSARVVLRETTVSAAVRMRSWRHPARRTGVRRMRHRRGAERERGSFGPRRSDDSRRPGGGEVHRDRVRRAWRMEHSQCRQRAHRRHGRACRRQHLLFHAKGPERLAGVPQAACRRGRLTDSSPQDTLADALRHVAEIGGEAGGILLTPEGRFAWDHNSRDFAVAFRSSAMDADAVYTSKREETA